MSKEYLRPITLEKHGKISKSTTLGGNTKQDAFLDKPVHRRSSSFTFALDHVSQYLRRYDTIALRIVLRTFA